MSCSHGANKEYLNLKAGEARKGGGAERGIAPGNANLFFMSLLHHQLFYFASSEAVQTWLPPRIKSDVRHEGSERATTCVRACVRACE